MDLCRFVSSSVFFSFLPTTLFFLIYLVLVCMYVLLRNLISPLFILSYYDSPLECGLLCVYFVAMVQTKWPAYIITPVVVVDHPKVRFMKISYPVCFSLVLLFCLSVYNVVQIPTRCGDKKKRGCRKI